MVSIFRRILATSIAISIILVALPVLAANARTINIAYTSYITFDPARMPLAGMAEKIISALYLTPLECRQSDMGYCTKYELLDASTLPKVTYINKQGKKVSSSHAHKEIAYTVIDLRLKTGVHYHTNPAVFKRTSPPITAQDYVYELKRVADPKIGQFNTFSLLDHIEGFTELRRDIKRWHEQHPLKPVPYDQFAIKGVNVLGDYHLELRLLGYHPHALQLLSTPVFVPIPEQADVNVDYYLQRHPISSGSDIFLKYQNSPSTFTLQPVQAEQFCTKIPCRQTATIHFHRLAVTSNQFAKKTDLFVLTPANYQHFLQKKHQHWLVNKHFADTWAITDLDVPAIAYFAFDHNHKMLSVKTKNSLANRQRIFSAIMQSLNHWNQQPNKHYFLSDISVKNFSMVTKKQQPIMVDMYVSKRNKQFFDLLVLKQLLRQQGITMVLHVMPQQQFVQGVYQHLFPMYFAVQSFSLNVLLGKQAPFSHNTYLDRVMDTAITAELRNTINYGYHKQPSFGLGFYKRARLIAEKSAMLLPLYKLNTHIAHKRQLHGVATLGDIPHALELLHW